MNKALLKKMIVVGVSVLLLTVCCSGCGNLDDPNTTEQQTYSTQLPMTVMQYTTYINREITDVQNQLTSQILLLDSLSKGECKREEALLSAEASLKNVKRIIESVDTTYPPLEMTGVRAEMLIVLENIDSLLNDYVMVLSDSAEISAEKIISLKNQMETISFTLTGYYLDGAI